MTTDFMPKSEKRSLKHIFTAVEINDLSMQLAHKTRELQAITEEKKTVGSQYTAKINEAKATTNVLSNQVTDGYEMKDIECDIEFHVPKQGMKTLTPRDGSKPIEGKMSDYDWNLFNQPDEKQVGELIAGEREKLAGKNGPKKPARKKGKKK